MIVAKFWSSRSVECYMHGRFRREITLERRGDLLIKRYRRDWMYVEPRLRVAFEMFAGGSSTKEVAGVLGISSGRTGILMYKVIKALLFARRAHLPTWEEKQADYKKSSEAHRALMARRRLPAETKTAMKRARSLKPACYPPLML